MCDQQRLRSACAYAQSDQSLCSSLEYSMSVKLMTEHLLEVLSLKRGCTGSSESTLVKSQNVKLLEISCHGSNFVLMLMWKWLKVKEMMTTSINIMSRDMRFQQCGRCDQQRLRPACAYAQSDQSLCWLLECSMSVKLLIKHHLRFPSLKEGCTGLSKSTLVKMPYCWKSCVTAHISLL